MLKTITIVLLSVIIWLISLCVYAYSLPNYVVGTLRLADGSVVGFEAPEVNREVADQTCTLDFMMLLGQAHITKFKCYGADTIKHFTINGRVVGTFEHLSKNAFTHTEMIDLEPYLIAGANSVHVEIQPKDQWLMFYLYPDIRDCYVLAVTALSSLVICLIIWLVGRSAPRAKITKVESTILLSGAVVRIIYSLSTAYFSRSYDVKAGHIPYIQFLSQYWHLPTSANHTLEYFQPPAYYLLCALTTQLPKALGGCFNSTIAVWQAESCFLTIVALAGCLVISRLVFEPSENRQRSQFFLCTAVFPSLIFNTSINNDVLFCTISILWVGLLITFWKKCSFKKWILIASLLGLGMLIKANTLPLILVSFLTLLATDQIGWKRKLVFSAVGSLLILLLAGWFYIPRALVSKSAAAVIVSNLDLVAKEIHINEDFSKIATFNPVAIVEYPFSSQTVYDPRREFFWEYFFRSAFFGENFFFANDPLLVNARVIVTSALLLLPVVLVGCISTASSIKSSGWPLTLVLLIVSVSQLIFVLQAPFICSQTFRYSVIDVIPLSFFVVQGLAKIPARLRTIGQIIFWIMLISCAIFMCRVCMR